MNKAINNNGYDYVDLWLPSGTLWATCNVGATKPSESGLYFQWGDTQGCTKGQVGAGKQFNWDHYKFSINGSSYDFSKYSTKNTKLDLEDDTAHFHMGGDWHMPSPEQIKELIDYTGCGRVMMERIGGNAFVSLNTSKQLCIPAAGNAEDGLIEGYGGYSLSLCSALTTYAIEFGQFLSITNNGAYLSGYLRCNGYTVRGVIG